MGGVVDNDSLFYKNINHLEIRYRSKKKKLIKAYPDGIGFLLKEDKDLHKVYGQEKGKTKAVLRKYLDKMNESSPDWDSSFK